MSRKRLVIGDIHGRIDIVKSIYNKEQPDDVILLGDYCDSFNHGTAEIRYCWEELLRMRLDHLNFGKGEFIMLLGNHDFHYIDGHEEYSGFLYTTWYAMNNDLKNSLSEGLLKIIYIDKEHHTIYSHAGITNTWLEKVAKGIDINDINACINWNHLRFNYLGGFNAYGDTIYHSPIWVRPSSLLSDMYTKDGITWTQIVGHTHTANTKEVTCFKKPNTGLYDNINDADLILMDTLPDGYLIEEIDDDKINRKYCLTND